MYEVHRYPRKISPMSQPIIPSAIMDFRLKTINISVHPKLYELLQTKYPYQGKVAGHIRHLIQLDVNRVAGYDCPGKPEVKRAIKVTMSSSEYDKLVRRADQAMCLNVNDYVKTLLQLDLFMSGDMQFTIAADLEDN